MKVLKEKTVRGGFARILTQGATFTLRIGSLMILARLIDPKEFGLVGMVTAFTGILNLFRDFGLGTAAVQHESVTHEQISNLFWLNVAVGGVLALATAATAPLIVAFYHEPRLFSLTIVLASALFFNSLGVQHAAILQRDMRFTALSVINVVAAAASSAAGIGLARVGFGYWALVAMALLYPIVSSIGFWITASWVPTLPRRGVGLRSMMGFGATVTLNSIVVYIAYNMEKALLGRFWGANAIGIYGRAYQLVSVPIDNLNSAAGEVAFSALSRIQNKPHQLRSYFLKGYSLILSLTIPAAFICAIFSGDLIAVMLGPKWKEAVPIFRLLSPTIAIFALINPFAWLLIATGRVIRSLKIALVIAPLVISGYTLGLPFGPKGVAIGYSVAMALWVVPHVIWCVQGTLITFGDVVKTASGPIISCLFAALPSILVVLAVGELVLPIARLALGLSIFTAIYGSVLLFIMGQKELLVDLIRGIRSKSVPDESSLADVSQT
jgi:PST family polysaccharide transporter